MSASHNPHCYILVLHKARKQVTRKVPESILMHTDAKFSGTPKLSKHCCSVRSPEPLPLVDSDSPLLCLSQNSRVASRTEQKADIPELVGSWVSLHSLPSSELSWGSRPTADTLVTKLSPVPCSWKVKSRWIDAFRIEPPKIT